MELSRSAVSDRCEGLDPLVQGENEWDLSWEVSPLQLVDALVIRIFPNRESVMRFPGAVLQEVDEAWSDAYR